MHHTQNQQHQKTHASTRSSDSSLSLVEGDRAFHWPDRAIAVEVIKVGDCAIGDRSIGYHFVRSYLSRTSSD